MILRLEYAIALTLTVVAAQPVLAQDRPVYDAAEYDRMKAAGEKIPYNALIRQAPQTEPLPLRSATGPVRPKGGGAGLCDLWQDPAPCPPSQGPNDDGSSPLIQLPFTFNLYGQTYTSLYINNNGNVTFDQPWGTFSAQPFPNAQFVMVAPFWGDVDTGEPGDAIGVVSYCVSDHRIEVTWDSVGYFNEMGDKLNTFQLIITDGTDPLIGVGNNVCFNYRDMQWTTGGASGGVNGFGGIPAVVGANLGDGVSYIQIGTFDHEGTDYDGPVGNVDGVSWLDYRSFVFSTETPVANIPPLVSGNILCDTIRVCVGESFDFSAEYYSPEPDQTTTITIDNGGLSNLDVTTNTSGVTANIAGTITGTAGEIGYYTVTIVGTDNGSPAASTPVVFVVDIIPSPGDPPVITGDSQFCEGGLAYLSVPAIYDSYAWSMGSFGPNVSVFEPGSYTVTVTNGGECSITSLPFIVTEVASPTPVITGSPFSCGGTPVTLSTTEPYNAYSWSNFASGPTTSVGTGSYTVTVTTAEGCTGTSAPFNVMVANDPTASFSTDPASPQLVGTTVQFTDQSNANGGQITSWNWTFGSLGTSTDPSPSQLFITPGSYNVILTVTTADGCVGSTQALFVIIPPDITVPNVISPNGDNANDYLVINNIEYWSNELTIYSRWGNEVYDVKNYKNQWKADDLPDGTYYYVLKLDDGTEHTGHITVLR